MSALGSAAGDDTPLQPAYHVLTVVLAVVVLAVFGGDRLLYETTGASVSWVLRYVLAGTVLAVGVSGVYGSFHGSSVATSILVASGPIIGLALYLLGYHLVLPPSTDSPTWLIFLAWAAGYVGVGLAAHLIGRVGRKASRRIS